MKKKVEEFRKRFGLAVNLAAYQKYDEVKESCGFKPSQLFLTVMEYSYSKLSESSFRDSIKRFVAYDNLKDCLTETLTGKKQYNSFCHFVFYVSAEQYKAFCDCAKKLRTPQSALFTQALYAHWATLPNNETVMKETLAKVAKIESLLN